MDDRRQFLISYYEKCWENISRAEDSVWKMFAAYAGLFAGSAFLFDKIGMMGFLGIFIGYSGLAMILTLNSHLWYLRNITLISNFEKEFLCKEDYGYLIPHIFKDRLKFIGFHSFEVWLLLFFGYLSISILVTSFFYSSLTCEEKNLVNILFGAVIVINLIYGICLKMRYDEFQLNCPGKPI
jgi:hypothetical protein